MGSLDSPRESFLQGGSARNTVFPIFEEFRVAPRFPWLSLGSSALLHLQELCCPWASPFPPWDTVCAASNSSAAELPCLISLSVCKQGRGGWKRGKCPCIPEEQRAFGSSTTAGCLHKQIPQLVITFCVSHANNPGFGIDKGSQKGKRYCHKGYKQPFIPWPHSTCIFLVHSVPTLPGCVGVDGEVCVCYFWNELWTKFPFSVVYEHRSRLEKSLQKERLEHKKAKEGKNVLFTLTFNLIIVESNFKWLFFNFKSVG